MARATNKYQTTEMSLENIRVQLLVFDVKLALRDQYIKMNNHKDE